MLLLNIFLTLLTLWIIPGKAIYLQCGDCLCEDNMKKALCQGRKLQHLTSIPAEARKSLETLIATGNMISTIHEDDISGYHSENVIIDLTGQTRVRCVQITPDLVKTLSVKYRNIEIKGLCAEIEKTTVNPRKKSTPRPRKKTSPRPTPSIRYIPIPFPVKPVENEGNDNQNVYTTDVYYNDVDSEESEDGEFDADDDDNDDTYANDNDTADTSNRTHEFTLAASIVSMGSLFTFLICISSRYGCQRCRGRRDNIELINITSATRNPIPTQSTPTFIIPFVTESLHPQPILITNSSEDSLYENVDMKVKVHNTRSKVKKNM